GIQQELSSTAHVLLRLRLLHPALSLIVAAYTAFAAVRAMRAGHGPTAERLAWWTVGLTFVQLIAGVVNVLLLAPVWMQILHLFLADALWLAAVLLTVESGREVRTASFVTESVSPASPSRPAS
ncbi:MAG TPA: COX15/CtaA family protein, partial [Bryobacteraceae bacterium]|nr:COX15/CtaA family protein [Bryobacteraceae bacterium]